LSPEIGSNKYYEFVSALGFVNSDLHKTVGKLFTSFYVPDWDATQAKAAATAKIQQFVKLYLDDGKKAFVGDALSVADIYAYIVLTWTPLFGLERGAAADAYVAAIAADPRIVAAHAAMNALVKK
jgi:glutathione S-transferase